MFSFFKTAEEVDYKNFFKEDFFNTPLPDTNPVQGNTHKSFPPYNILLSKDGNRAKLQLAVAGFTSDNINVETEPGLVLVKGSSPDVDVSGEWIVQKKGIAERNFSLTFRLHPSFTATESYMSDGILVIVLLRVKSDKSKLIIKSAPQVLNE